MSLTVPSLANGTSGSTTTISEVQVKVNVLNGVSISDEEIKEILKGVNDILKKRGVNVRVASDPNINRNVSDTGNDDGDIQNGEMGSLDSNGRKELDSSFGKAKGIKIYFANKLGDSNSTRGMADARDINSSIPKCMVYLKKISDTNESKSNDATHEILHILCLSGGHTVDPNTVADSNGHTSDPNNIMYPYNPYPDPCDPNQTKGRGDDITPEQKKTIESGAKKIGKSKEVERGKEGPAKPPPKVTPGPIKRSRWDDTLNDVPVLYNDLSYGFIISEMPFRDLDFYIVYNGLFTNPEYTDLKVWVYLNTDNNNMTGSMFDGMPGIDRRLELDVDFPSNYVYKGCVITNVYKTGDPDYTTIVPGSIETIGKVYDNDYNGMPPSTSDSYDGIHLNIPMYLLGELADEVPVKIVSDDYYSGVYDEAAFVWEVVDHNEPVFELVNTRVYPGGSLHVTGSNFTPLSDVRITAGDELIGVAISDSMGNIDEDFFFPGNWPFDGYFITAQDISGRSDFSFVEYSPNVADLDWDTKVDFLDFAVIADNWLSGYDY